MGYQLPRKTLRVAFDGTAYDGAEVVLSLNASLRSYLEFSEDRAKITERQVLELIADRIVEWNLEFPDGQPIPATLDGFLSLDDVGFFFTLWEQWDKAVRRSVDPDPLSSGPLSNGAISETLS